MSTTMANGGKEHEGRDRVRDRVVQSRKIESVTPRLRVATRHNLVAMERSDKNKQSLL